MLCYHQVLNKEEVNNDVLYYAAQGLLFQLFFLQMAVLHLIFGFPTLLACEIRRENPIFHQELPLDVHRKEHNGKTMTIIFNTK